MKSYKNTLNLPKTKFPMKGNLSSNEPKTLNKWYQNNIYQIIRNNNCNKPLFIIHDGPPYANGNIHIGHAINKILKDIIIKSKTLCGFNTPYIPFWDCHGLPIEHQIEKKIGKPKNKIEKKIFRKICQEYVIKQVKKQKSDFIRLGVFGDWENYQLTIDKSLEANVIRVLGKIIENKYLYQGFKPVHWCIKCQSALADAEVEYYDKKEIAITVLFKSSQVNKLNKIFLFNKNTLPIYIAIWTTTPWTIPANRAIAVHPDFEYQLIQYENKNIIIAKELVQIIMKKNKIKKWKTIYTIYGKQLEYSKFYHPFLKLEIPIILSKHITLTTGTGIVHIAPDHGEEDYNISQKYNIKITNIIDDKGYYKNNVHININQLNIFKSNNIIINLIKNNNLLFHSENIEHSYPHCWRHKYPIIYRTTDQWFINTQNHSFKENILKQIKKVNWIPDWGYKRMHTMILNRPDWCISRQKTWGIPITIFQHKKTNVLHPNTIEIINKIADLIELHGSEIWWHINKKDILGQNYQEYKKCTDILDVWFESGCINNLKLYNLGNKKKYTNMYLEGSDQYRGWFMSSLIISQTIKKNIPYHEVLTHGFAIDKFGQKMSKSIGNVITPKDIIKIFGADVLRLWVASTNYTNDIVISEDTIKQISDHYRRIRNTSRFLLSNIHDFNAEIHTIDINKMILLDQWILYKTYKLQKKIITLYHHYQFHKIIKKILKFCSIELGAFYLDIIKDRQYTCQKNSIARRSCQTALYYIIQSLVRWITPILPFTADEIWNHILHNQSQNLFIQEWFQIPSNFFKNKIINNDIWSIFLKLKTEVNKIIEIKKKENIINHSLACQVILYVKNDLYDSLIIFKNELKFLLLVSQVKIKKNKKKIFKKYNNTQIENIEIVIKKFFGIKCPRCWNYFNKINLNNKNKDLCNRCNNNIYEDGENRQFL